MVKHCKALGFDPTIFTTYSKYREEKNDDWLVELAGNEFNLITLKSLSQHITRKFKIGDLGLRFIPFLFFRLIKECKKQKPDFIIYPVPPWYLLIIAPIVKKITGVKYAIDFIDPWVSADTSKKIGFKKNFTQWIARMLEGWVTHHASYIYAVSNQINQDLISRHPLLKDKLFKAIPYGVEISDFEQPITKNNTSTFQFNYIGAVWTASHPVVYELLQAFKKISTQHSIKVDFIGTSYAGEGLAKKSLSNFITTLNLENIVFENPNRVTYKEAVELTLNSDVLFLFGDMSKQYAASKLMGLIASRKPFIAFVHEASFPYQFLKSFDYKYLIGYSNEDGNLPKNKKDNLANIILDLISNIDQYESISIDDKKFLNHTAFGMTKNILEPIKEILDYDKSLPKN